MKVVRRDRSLQYPLPRNIPSNDLYPKQIIFMIGCPAMFTGLFAVWHRIGAAGPIFGSVCNANGLI
jgi:hypothetical protein